MPPGWLRAVADDQLRPILTAIHAQPAHPWTLATLARISAMSRTTFSEHFRVVAGIPPMTYLKRLRIHLAERSLRTEDTPIGKLAADLGYGSDSSFNNTFKSVSDISPFNYRKKYRGTLAV
ncbi:helix-turn-helix domain-containing protein [Streptomyces iranensis]